MELSFFIFLAFFFLNCDCFRIIKVPTLSLKRSHISIRQNIFNIKKTDSSTRVSFSLLHSSNPTSKKRNPAQIIYAFLTYFYNISIGNLFRLIFLPFQLILGKIVKISKKNKLINDIDGGSPISKAVANRDDMVKEEAYIRQTEKEYMQDKLFSKKDEDLITARELVRQRLSELDDAAVKAKSSRTIKSTQIISTTTTTPDESSSSPLTSGVLQIDDTIVSGIISETDFFEVSPSISASEFVVEELKAKLPTDTEMVDEELSIATINASKSSILIPNHFDNELQSDTGFPLDSVSTMFLETIDKNSMDRNDADDIRLTFPDTISPAVTKDEILSGPYDVYSVATPDMKRELETVTSPPLGLKDQIKSAGISGTISYIGVELIFWAISFPIIIGSYHSSTGQWLSLSDPEDQAKILGLSAAFTAAARLLVPVRLVAAVALMPWVESNILPKLDQSNNGETQA